MKDCILINYKHHTIIEEQHKLKERERERERVYWNEILFVDLIGEWYIIKLLLSYKFSKQNRPLAAHSLVLPFYTNGVNVLKTNYLVSMCLGLNNNH